MSRERPAPKINIQHEFTGEEGDEIQLGLKLWAAFLVEEIRKNVVARLKGAGRSA